MSRHGESHYCGDSCPGGHWRDAGTVCQHYLCDRTDIAPYLWQVLGQTVGRWLCPVHAPEEVRRG